MMNRHGLVAGATGTGKTVTLHMMAEQLSTAGVPVFLADIKGDLSGLATAAAGSEKLKARTDSIGQPWSGKTFPWNSCPRRRRSRYPGPLHHHLLRPHPAVPGDGTQRDPGVQPATGLPLRGQKRPRADRPQGPAGGHPVPDLDEGKDELENLGGLSKSTAGVILRELVTLEAQGMESFSANRSSTPPNSCGLPRTAAAS